MKILIKLCVLILLVSACKKEVKTNDATSTIIKEVTEVPLKYAKGFTIKNYETYKEVLVTSAWPNSDKNFRYLVVNEGEQTPEHTKEDVVVKLPINKLVVMSTTNIPALEYLDIDDKLVGFPSTNYISSEKTKKRVDNGEIKDLNNNLEINMELLLELQPELVVGFSVNGNNKSLNQMERFGIPVVLDGAWTEASPLGRAEWLKFIAVFFNKDEKANAIFKDIESNYLNAKQIAKEVKEQPVVFSGSMFKEVWNIPGGQSFVAKYLEDANTNYLYKDTNKNGSLQLNFENVLEKGQSAKLWIGAGSFKSRADMLETHKGYSYFEAFKSQNIYTYTKNVTENGGLPYFELGPLRPDLVLKDVIKISHPELLADYETTFFKKID